MTTLLTKSLYKIGLECPRKLYYQIRKNDFINGKSDDDFLAALAEGGFQVGELAKLYHPGGVDIDTLDKAEALKRTQVELQKENATVFEGAISIDGMFIRVDILEKRGKTLKLIEVKAKSYSSEDSFWQKRNPKKLNRDWEPYLQDAAFQTYVTRKAYPDLQVIPHLMLADKDAKASRDGLHQLFLIQKTPEGRSKVINLAKPGEDLGTKILKTIEVSREVDFILSSEDFKPNVETFKKILNSPTPPKAMVSSACKSCEFYCDEFPEKSGFHLCFKEHGLSDEELKKPLIFDLSHFSKTDEAIARDIILMEELDEMLVPHTSGTDSFSRSDRQWLQIDFARGDLKGVQILTKFLKNEIKALKWPVHFIDFETTMVAIPFFKGASPYNQLAFQFSHHTLYEEGRIEHPGEYLHPTRTFPNFDFARALMKSLSKDEGSIFRYSHHENTVVNQIIEQLEASKESDKKELIDFLKSISHTKEHTGARDMLDLCEWVQSYYWHPRMGKSNSIKVVLPAVMLDQTKLLQEKFPEWFKFDDEGQPMDPYKLLPPLFTDLPQTENDAVMVQDTLSDGAAAMTAYARLQFEEMPLAQDKAIREALLRYCKLDTLAMVMIFWRFFKG